MCSYILIQKFSRVSQYLYNLMLYIFLYDTYVQYDLVLGKPKLRGKPFFGENLGSGENFITLILILIKTNFYKEMNLQVGKIS